MTISRLAATTLALVLTTGSLAAEEISKDYHEKFDVARGDSLMLDHGDGDVFIESWDRDVLDVQVVFRARTTRVGLGGKVGLDVDFRRDGSRIRVVGRETGRVGIGFFSYNELDYRYIVKAPNYLILDLEGEDGDVDIRQWRANLSIRSEDGDLELADIEAEAIDLIVEDGDIDIEGLVGKLDIVTEDGDVMVTDCLISDARVEVEDGNATFEDCRGSARFDLVDGDLELRRFRPDGVGIRSEDGDVDLDLLAGSVMDVNIRTTDGDITVDLESGSSASFELDTDDGGINLELPGATDVKERRSSASGRVGSGEGRLVVESDDGRIVLRSAS